MDVGSLVREGTIVRASVRAVYAEPKDGPNGVKVWAILSRMYFDCADRRSVVKQATAFADRDFKEPLHVGPDSPDALLDWSEVPPDSRLGVLLEFACSHALPK